MGVNLWAFLWSDEGPHQSQPLQGLGREAVCGSVTLPQGFPAWHGPPCPSSSEPPGQQNLIIVPSQKLRVGSQGAKVLLWQRGFH